MKIQLKRSNVLQSGAAKEPTASQLEYGELAINYNNSDPAIFLKDSNNNIIRISGVGNIADDGLTNVPAGTTPPTNPTPESGNLWYNSDEGRLYIYYVDANTSQWVDASPDSWDPTVMPVTTNPAAQTGTLDDRYVMENGDTMTGALILPSGTAAAPALGVGSTDNGLYSPGTDEVALATSGTNRLHIASDGNVGIGETSPASKLSVNGDIGLYVNATEYGKLFNDAGVLHLRGAANMELALGTQAQERMRIDSSGNVGIGLTNISGSGSLTLVAGQSYKFAGSGGNTIYGDISADTSHNITFKNNNGSERMRIDSSGRLGVGTSSPNAGLNVGLGGNTIPTAGAATGSALFGNATAGNAYGLVVGATSGGLGYIQAQRADGTATTYNLAVQPNGGNVGIGTTSPGRSLHVAGGSNSIVIERTDATTSALLCVAGSNQTEIYSRATNSSTTARDLAVHVGSSEALRVDTSKRLLVGTSSARSNFYGGSASAILQAEGSGTNRRISIIGSDATSGDPSVLILGRQRSGSIGGNTILQDDDWVSTLSFQGNDGTYFVELARIDSFVDGTPGNDDMPGRLVFSTNPGSPATGPTERMRIDSSGNLMLGTTTPGAGGGDELTLATSGQTGITIRSGTTSKGAIYFADGTSGSSRYEGYFEYDHNGDYLRIGTSDGERLRILATGGLTFNGDTATANALDDYEEGNWTPGISRLGTAPTVSFSYQTGNYTKIGRLVLVYFDLNITSISGGSNRYVISSLPFTSSTDSTNGGYGAPQFRSTTSFNVDARINNTSAFHDFDKIQLLYMNNSGVQVDTSVGTGRITGWSVYMTNA